MSEGLQPGDVVGGRYRIVRRLGVGGMGMVYLANVQGAGGFEKLVALKVTHDHVSADAGAMDMFLAEARLSAQLQHGNLGQVYDLGRTDDLYFIAMEYIRGVDLRALITASSEAGQRLPVPLLVLIVSRLLAALDYAHDFRDKAGKPMRLVHRDVTPVNCLISYTGDVKLIDFGIAKAATSASRTKTGFVRGKLNYMSPEQARGASLDRRSDVFAAGVVLYELLLGFRPFDDVGGDMDMIGNLIAGRYRLPRELDPSVPEALEAVVKKALQVDRDARFLTAGAMQEELEQWLLSTRMRVGARELATYVVKMCPPGEVVVPGEVTGETGESGGAITPLEEPVVELVRRDTLRNIPPVPLEVSPAATRLKPARAPVPLGRAQSLPTLPAMAMPSPVQTRTDATAVPRPGWWPFVAGLIALTFGAIGVLLARQITAPEPAPIVIPVMVTPAPVPVVVPPPAPSKVEPEPEPVVAQPPEPVKSAPKPKKSAPTPVAVVAPLKAYLVVNASGSAEVFLDGTGVGRTPLKLTAKPGKHELRVDCGGVKGAPAPVTLPPEQEVEVNHRCP